MAIHALFLTALSMMALGLLLTGQLVFLAPYRDLLLHAYLTPVALYFSAVGLNLFAAFYYASRVLFLKDAGAKLAHLEKQLRSEPGLSDELARRLGG